MQHAAMHRKKKKRKKLCENVKHVNGNDEIAYLNYRPNVVMGRRDRGEVHGLKANSVRWNHEQGWLQFKVKGFKGKSFSMSYVNIRSFSKNFKSFNKFYNLLNFEFSLPSSLETCRKQRWNDKW